MKSFLASTAVLAAATLTVFANYQPVPLEQGASAPGFELLGTDDQSYTLDDVQGKTATAVIFTTNHCPDAIAAVDRIKALVDKFQEKGVGFVAINSNSPEGLHPAELGWTIYDDSFADMKRIAKDEKFNLPYLYDGDTQEVAKAYGAVATPHIFIFDSNLTLKYNGRLDDGRRSLGPAEKNEAHDALTAILAGKTPAVIKTRPVGCTTKWKEKAGKVAEEDKKWKANPVTVETVDAETISKLTANKSSKGFRLFNVWATTCGPCVMEFHDLAEIYRQYHWQHFEFVTISLDPPKAKEKVTEFLQEHHVGLPAKTKRYLDKEDRKTNNFIFEGDTEDLVKALDPTWNGAMPHTLLVGAEGKVLYRHTGTIDPIELKKAIVKEVWAQSEE